MISENIKKARELAGMTQQQLADRIGVHQSVVAGFETGIKIPSLRVAKELSNALSISIDELVKGKEA